MTKNDKLDLLIDKVELLARDMGDVKEDISILKEDVCGLKEDVCDLKEDVRTLKEDVIALKEDNISLKSSMRDMQIMTENLLWLSIKRVAEGHLDLSRQSKEALKPNQEVEMLSVRVSILESEVQNMKQKIS